MIIAHLSYLLLCDLNDAQQRIVFTLETNNESLPKFVQTDNASCSIKTAIHEVGRKNVCVPSGRIA